MNGSVFGTGNRHEASSSRRAQRWPSASRNRSAIPSRCPLISTSSHTGALALTGVVTTGSASVAGFTGIPRVTVFATAGVATLGGEVRGRRANRGESCRGAFLIGSATCDRCRVVWIIELERLVLACDRLPRADIAWGWTLIT